MTDKTDHIEAIAKANGGTVPNGGLLYSWGGDNHHTLATFKPSENVFSTRYNQAQSGGARGGPGLYLSTNIYDSADYCPATGGVLLEVTIRDNTPYIDSQDRDVMKDVKAEAGVKAQDLYANGDDKPKILLRYDRTWFALKTLRGVTFRFFDGRTFRNEMHELKAQYAHLHRDGRTAAKAVLKKQMRDDWYNEMVSED